MDEKINLEELSDIQEEWIIEILTATPEQLERMIQLLSKQHTALCKARFGGFCFLVLVPSVAAVFADQNRLVLYVVCSLRHRR